MKYVFCVLVLVLTVSSVQSASAQVSANAAVSWLGVPRSLVSVEVLAMEPIFDRRGSVVAWIKGEDIYDLDGSHVAVLNGWNVYGHQGQHLGVIDRGLFRDHRGGAVAFTRGARGGPILPIPAIPPIPPIPSISPIPAIPSIPPIPAIPSLGWSAVDWRSFIRE
jgi:hypothetical protein